MRPPEAPRATPTSTAPTGFILAWDPSDVYDLRGLRCEERGGAPQCFVEDAQGRELCPGTITPEALAFPTDQPRCTPGEAARFFCTVSCQEGGPDVRWRVHDVAACAALPPGDAAACPPRPAVVPKAAFALKPWSEPVPTPTACQLAKERGGAPPGVLEELSVGMLTHEAVSLRHTLATYAAHGFFDLVPEFTVYANRRSPEVDEVLAPCVAQHGAKFRVLGDAADVGIARGIVALVAAATKPYFLFLERDFQLIEPDTCVHEQLAAGVALLRAGTAHVVRFRHRRRPGRPNWPDLAFRGHEDDVFAEQPNLFCNHYYWVPEPEKRWPDKIWVCNDAPQMYCSDSFYCNWTNNPQMWRVDWWGRDVTPRFAAFTEHDANLGLEHYMNWEHDAWNRRHFIVAQGDGLFTHRDRDNYW